MKSSAVLLFLVVAFAGCDTETAGSHLARSGIDPKNVQILKHRPDVPYETVGNVTATEDYMPEGANASTLTGGADVMSDLRERAAALGADAVIVTSNQILPPMFGGQSTRNVATGIAIRLKKTDVPPAAAPLANTQP